ncbi:Tetratricopeptide repeat protein 27 [Chlorella vulgaris]
MERQLLLNSFAVATQAPPLGPAAAALLQQGDHAGALAAALSAVWEAAGTVSTPESTPDWFDAAGAAFTSLLTSHSGGQAAAVEQVLLLAVAALHLFTQANLSGPAIALPECPFDWLSEAAAAEWRQGLDPCIAVGGGDGAGSEAAGFGRDSTTPGDRWAAAQLSESGEDLIGRVQYPQYLLLARMALLAPLAVSMQGSSSGGPGNSGGSSPAHAAGAPAIVGAAPQAAWLSPDRLPAWCWWALRAVLLQQRLLSGRSAALRSLLLGLAEQVLAGQAVPVEGSVAQLAGSGGSSSGGVAGAPGLEDQLLAAGALLEAALLEAAFGHAESASRYLQRGGSVLGFKTELTGALGTRTVHQQEAKAQLLVAVSRDSANPWTAAYEAGRLPGLADARSTIEAATTQAQQDLPAELKGFSVDSDVLPHPVLVPAGDGGSSAQDTPRDLHPLEQALLLGWGLHVRKGGAADGMQPWEVAAYMDAVAQQERTQFLLHAAAVLQASRLEKTRSRTRDRALLQLEQLAESLDRGCPELPPNARLRYAFSAWFPLRLSLRKELGELLVGLGLVGSALSLFEGLELWDNLIVCYQLLDKKVQAEELIKRRLEVTPGEPRLWCALGDLCLDDAHYLQAWECSGHRNARAQRSLARNALRNSSYSKAAAHWELALALNPLHGEGWFSLGYACIKEKEYGRALQAFTRSSQLEPENGEAWNNLAAIHMHMRHWKQAYNALSEAVKHKRDSWQTWDNYAQVAVRVQQWQTAVRALQQVLVQSEGQRVDLGVLAALVGQVEAGRGIGPDSEAAVNAAEQAAARDSRDAAAAAEADLPADPAVSAAAESSGAGMADLVAALGELNGRDEQEGATSGGAGDGSATAAAEAADALQKADARSQAMLEQAVGNLLKQVAATVSGDSAFWEVYARYQSATGFPDAAKECLLKRAAAAGGTGAQRDLSSARLHLRGLIKQAYERYEEEPAYVQLQELLAEVERA